MSDWQSNPLAIEDSIAYRVHRLARLQRKHFANLARRHGLDLTAEMWFILNRLRRQDGRPQNALGDAIFSDRPNLTRMFARLESRGWIRRSADPVDGRKVLIWLTADGIDVHDRFSAVAGEARTRLFGGLSVEDLAQASATLARVEAELLKDL